MLKKFSQVFGKCRWIPKSVIFCSLALQSTGITQEANPGVPGEGEMFFQAPNGDILGTGVRRPTAEQWAWGEQNMIKTKKVKLNKLGLARINQSRAGRGENPINENDVELTPIGQEAIGAAGDATGGTSTTAPQALPTYVDNSTLKFFPPIRSQGSLGSCAQFSAVYYTLTHMTAMARDWDAKNGGDTFRFSPKWTYNMLNGGANVGTWHYDAYAIAQKHGLATWAEFPYDGNYTAWCLNPSVWRNAISVRADQTAKVIDADTDAGLNKLKQLLNNGYVLNFATYINSWQWKAISNDQTTTADDAFAGKQCITLVNGTSGGHAMTIVGYSDDIWVDLNSDGLVNGNEKGALRIANSWGASWGEAGFCWVSYQSLRTRNAAKTSEGLFWYDEATWVTARSSYSPQLIAEFSLNHLKRNQLRMTLGISDIVSTTPTTTWSPNRVLTTAGGALAFNGTTTACDATFYLDATELIPTATTTKRYYVGLYDSTIGDIAALNSFKLIDLSKGVETVSAVIPVTADAGQKYSFVEYTATGTAASDTVSPVISLTSPSEGAQVNGTITVSASASDNLGLAGVTFYVDNIAKSTLSTAHYNFAWDSASVANGSHTLTVLAQDVAGNTSYSAITVNVSNVPDTTAPTITITTPAAGAKISGATVKVAVKAQDNVGVVKVHLYVDNALTVISTIAPYTLSWNTKKLTTGTHSLYCVAYDKAGNVGTSPVITVTK